MNKYVKLSNLLAGLPNVQAVAILTAKLGYKRDLPDYVFAAPDHRECLERVECWWDDHSLQDAIDSAENDCDFLGRVEDDIVYQNFDAIVAGWFEEVK